VALVDNNPDSYNIDFAALRKAIESGYAKDASKNALVSKRSGRVLKAIMPVHLYGQMADMPQIMELAKRHGLFVVEDACQAHGAWHSAAGGEKRRAGSWGDVGCFSFYPSKNLGAYGDGGMIVTSSPELMERIRLLRNYGQRVKYYHDAKGLNTRLDEIQAAVVAAKLPHLDKWNGRRHAIAAKFHEMLAGLPLKLPVEMPSRSHIYHLFVLRLKQRDAMMEHLKAKGVGTIIHYPVPIHTQKAYADLGYKKGDFPECENCANEILSLPMFAELTDDEVNWMGQAVREFFR
jgi:dTDP-4-amino-4,6-dideoxygalactose transaminase